MVGTMPAPQVKEMPPLKEWRMFGATKIAFSMITLITTPLLFVFTSLARYLYDQAGSYVLPDITAIIGFDMSVSLFIILKKPKGEQVLPRQSSSPDSMLEIRPYVSC